MNTNELRTYIPFAMARDNMSFGPDGSVHPNPQNLPASYFPAFLYESYKADVRAANLEVARSAALVSYADFARVYGMLQDSSSHALKFDCVDALRFSGTEDLAPLRTFAKALTGSIDETIVAVLAHFLSNVKRKMLQSPVTYHMMPMLTGRQKGGKSTAVRKLLSPLGETVHETTITSSLKAENFMMFAQYFVVFFDEMEGIQKSSIAALKKMVTEERSGGRVYYTQRNVNLPNLCSFIGTANDSAMELIDDKTGARRFFEIKCADRLDWAALNSINYQKLWQGIDETKKSGYYLAAEEAIDRRQQDLVSVDLFVMFLQETQLYPDPLDASEDTWIPTKLFYKIYLDWLEAYKAQALHPATFFKKLLAHGFERIIRKSAVGDRKGQSTVYRVSSKSAFIHLEKSSTARSALEAKLK
jgi:hypothetical protein